MEGMNEDRVAQLENEILRLIDRESIRELIFEYQRLCDGGWSGSSHPDPDALSELFTIDGEYQIDPSRPPNKGREAIRDSFVRLQKSMPWIIHYATNPMITVVGDIGDIRAQGFALYRRGGDDFIATGTYLGKVTRQSSGWQFSSWIFELAHSRTL